VGVLVGLTTGMYALSLAAVTTLQVASDQTLIEERAPVRDAIGLLADHHDRLAARLDMARRRYEEASGGYGDLSDRLAAVHDDIEKLGRTVTTIEGSAFALPGQLDLPAVPRIARARAAPPPPATQATTGASGKP
jgi:hypothetical protein